VTVAGKKFRNLTAVFNFNEDRTSFTGHDLDRNRKVTTSPMVDSREIKESPEQTPLSPRPIHPRY
jgi:hypothetical protein